MSKRSLVELVVGIILVGFFLVSWLVFKNIKTSDWVALLLSGNCKAEHPYRMKFELIRVYRFIMR